MVYFKSNIDYCCKMIIFNFLNCPKMQNDFPGEYILHILLKKFPAKKISVIDVFQKSSLEIHEKCSKCPGNFAFIDVFQKSSPKIHKKC